MQILLVSEGVSLVEDANDEEGESHDHHERERYIERRSCLAIVAEHDSNIREVPPEICTQQYECDEYQYEGAVSKWFCEIREHRKVKRWKSRKVKRWEDF